MPAQLIRTVCVCVYGFARARVRGSFVYVSVNAGDALQRVPQKLFDGVCVCVCVWVFVCVRASCLGLL